MRVRRFLPLLIAASLSLASAAPQELMPGLDSWPQWRGPGMNGLAGQDADPPVRWSETDNVAWKVDLPGAGSSTPVLRGPRLFLQTAVEEGNGVIRFMVMSLSRETGETLWSRVVRAEDPGEAIQPNNTWASGSPMVDDDRVYAFFGSRGIYAFDHDGEPLWERDLGELETRGGFGEGNSAGLHDSWILVNWDQEGESWLIALDTEAGEEIWRVARDEPTTWYTPVVAEVGGRAQVVTAGTNAVRGYDLETGELIWHGPGLTLNAIPSPVIVDDVAYLTAGYRGEALMAVDLGRARGDLAESGAMLWRYDHDTPYVSSPLVYGGVVYFMKGLQEILTAVDAVTGELVYGPVRVEGLTGVYASPVGAAGRVYLPGRQGGVAVLQAGREFRVLAVNHLDAAIDASPVIVDDELYLRGKSTLYRISADD